MIISKIHAEFALYDKEDDIMHYNRISKTDNPCKIIGNVKGIELKDIYGNVGPVFDINIKLNINGKEAIIKSYGVTNYGGIQFDGQTPGLYIKQDGKNYDPQIGDIIIAKVNPENNYIVELLPTKGKEIQVLSKEYSSIDLPQCKMVKENTTVNDINSNQEKGSIFLFYGIIIGIVISIIIWLIYIKFNKTKKQG